jgi:hypothetical protein
MTERQEDTGSVSALTKVSETPSQKQGMVENACGPSYLGGKGESQFKARLGKVST